MIDGVPVSVLSASALLGLAVLMLLTGRLVPRVNLMDKIREADRWREAYEKERETSSLANAQVSELLEVAKTTHAIISAMARTSEHLRGNTDGILQEER